MAVKIRLARYGRKKKPFFRIVVADERFTRDGRFLERVGTYNPRTRPSDIFLEKDRVAYWLSQGAIPTETVKNILKKQDVAV